ncbi:hypothetical protein FRC08_010084 [Ceratobasidium sp. 394]|nr:hypothetical protein FRC08_010084 [Ceratobasidium sp. 394]
MLSIAAISLAEPCQRTAPNGPDSQDLVSEMKCGFGHGHGHGRKHKNRRSVDLCLSEPQTEQLLLGVFYVHATVLALLAVALESIFRMLCNSHLVLLLILALMVDFWVVILPTIATWLSSPSRTPLEWVSWARTAVLAFAAIVIPVYIQRSYILQQQTPKPSVSNRTATGRLVAKNLTARYSPNGPAALSRVSFVRNPGQRTCVVGTVRSGKRTLALTLLRAIHTHGTVYLDGISTHTRAPEALHVHITFISEQPGVTFGTVRETLDPQKANSDVALCSTLRSVSLEVGLDALVDDLSEEQRVRVLLAKAISWWAEHSGSDRHLAE